MRARSIRHNGRPFFEVRGAGRRERVIALGLLVALVGIAAVLTRRHPSSLRFLPTCPSKAVLHIECPGCGSTRAIHYLLNLQGARAWRYNPAAILLGLPMLGLLALDLAATLFVARRIVFGPGGRFGQILVFALLAYALARNLPLPAFDFLRP